MLLGRVRFYFITGLMFGSQPQVRRVGDKLGFNDDGSDADDDVTDDFKFADVVMIYDICRFEKVVKLIP